MSRSFGVLIWEIVTYAQIPLGDTSVEDIINAAQNKTLYHERYAMEVDVLLLPYKQW